LLLPYLVRILGTEKFGLVMFAQSLCLFLTVIVDFGFSLSGTRKISLHRNNKTKMSQIFISIMFIKSALIVVAFFLLFWVVMAFDRFSVDYEIYFLSFGIVIGQAIFPVWFFQGIEKMKFITIVNVLAKVIFTILVIVFVKSSVDYKQVPIYNSLGFIISGLLGLIISVRYISLTTPSFKLIYQLIKETTPLFVANFASMLYTSSNVLILGFFSNNAVVGIYSSMEKLMLAIKNIYTPIYQALFPWLSQQVDQKKIEVTKKIRPYVLGLGILITLIIVLFTKQILTIIYDDELITEYSLVFKILSFVAIFSGLNMLYVGLYFPAVKNYKIRMGVMASGGILNIILALILVNLFDIYGASISVFLTELYLLIIGLYYFNKHKKN
jgi:PST family polysaccharide transporter